MKQHCIHALASLFAVYFSLSAAQAQAPAPAKSPADASAPAKGASMPKLKLQRVSPEVVLRRPIQVVFEPGNDERMYVVEQPGRVLVLDPAARDSKEAPVFMDIRKQVNSAGNEEGLLSLAFHPDFAKNSTFFVYYTMRDQEGQRHDVLSRWTMDKETRAAKPGSETVLLSIEDPYSNHNGGTILFGPDGMLYLSCGDGGAANDPKFAGQDLGTLLAKVLRIDVDHPEGDRPYGIPKDNPFVGVAGARPEIWAYGLRNVWRMSFDRSTGELYAGDVGQNQYEEVDIITKGGNYGWNPREALHAFPGGQAGKFGSDYIDPIAEYPHSEGVSITGGFVCRGKDAGALDGVYLYADLVSCRIWGLRAEKGKLVAGPEVLHTTRNHLPTSFGQANDGTVYLVTFEGSQDPRAKGAVWRISAER
jgi:glucose/arabinose dehydrogenase